MKRRDLFRASLAASTALAFQNRQARAAEEIKNPLKPSANGPMPVAFLISDGAVMIDFAGPWEVFQDVMLDDLHMPFHTYTVAKSAAKIRTSGGMHIVPDFTFANAPAPKVIVIPAQGDDGPEALNWVRKASQTADVTMSVCTGAFLLAKTGLLDGKSATTHHNSFKVFEKQFPNITLKRGARFVDDGNLASAGGLTSGMDLAMHVVERYFGREVAATNAFYMEYQGTGWKDASGASNTEYVNYKIRAGYEEDPVCGMEIKPGSLKSDYKGVTYYFCMESCRQQFVKAPESYLNPAPQRKSM